MEKSSKLYLLQEYMKEYNRGTSLPHDSKNKDNDEYLSLYNDINNEDQYIYNTPTIDYKNINEIKNFVDMNDYLSTKNLLNENSTFDGNKEEIDLRNGSLDIEHIKYGNLPDINIQDVHVEDAYIKDLDISNEQFENESYPNNICKKELITQNNTDIPQDYNINETIIDRSSNKPSSYKQYNMNDCCRKNNSFNNNIMDNICNGNEKYKMSDNKQICEIIKAKEHLIIDEICSLVKNANKKIKNQVQEYKNKNISVLDCKENINDNCDMNNSQNILHTNEGIEEYKLNENNIHNTVKITKEVYSCNSFSSNSDTTLSYESVNKKKKKTKKEEIKNHCNNVEEINNLTKEDTLIYKSDKEYTKKDIENINNLNMECKLNSLNNNEDTSDISTNNNTKDLYPKSNSNKSDIFNNSIHIRNIINNSNLEDFKNINTVNNASFFNYKKDINKNNINYTNNKFCSNIEKIHLKNIEETECDKSFLDIIEKREIRYDSSDTYKKEHIKNKELQIGCFLKEENNNKTDILKNPLKEEIRHLKLKSKNIIVKEQTSINDISNAIEEHFYSTYISKDALIGVPTNNKKYNNDYYNLKKNIEGTKETIQNCNKYFNQDIQKKYINNSFNENSKQSFSGKEQVNKENMTNPDKNEQVILNIKNIETPHIELNSIDEKKYFNINEKDFYENFKEHIENDSFDYSIMEENRKGNIDTNFYYDNKHINKNKIISNEFSSDKERYIKQNEPSLYNKSPNTIKNNDYNEKVKYMISSINESCKLLKRTSLYNEKKNLKTEPSLLLKLGETNTLENKLNDSFESQVIEKVSKNINLEHKAASNYKHNNNNNNNNIHNNKKKKYGNICTNIYNNYDQKGYKENINIKLTSLNHTKRSNTPSIMIADVLKIIDKNTDENYKERTKFLTPYNNKNIDDENNSSYNNIKISNIKNEKSNKIGYPKNSNRKVVNIKSHYISKYNNMFLYMDTEKKKKNEEKKTYKKLNVPCHKKIYECEKRDNSKEIIKIHCKKDDKNVIKKQCSLNEYKKEKLIEQKLPNFGGQEIPIWGGIEIPNWEEEYMPLEKKIREPYVEEKKEEKIKNKIIHVNSNNNKIHYPSPSKVKKNNSIHNAQETEKLRKLKNNNGNNYTYEKGEEKNKNICSSSRNNSLTSIRNKSLKNIKKNVLTKKDSILNQDKLNDGKYDIKKMEKKKINVNSQINHKIDSDKKKNNKFEKYGKYGGKCEKYGGKCEKYVGKCEKYPLDIEASFRCKNLYLKISVDTNSEQILKYIPNKISKRNMEFKLIITKFIDGFIKCTESKIYKSSNIILQNIETDISYNITIHAYNNVVSSLWLYASISFYLTKFNLENFKLKTPCYFTLAKNTDFLNFITNNDNEKKIVPLKSEKNITQKIILHNINEKKITKDNELTNDSTNMLKDIEEENNQQFHKNNSTCSDEENSDESIVPIKNLHIQNNLEFKGIKNEINSNINISTRNKINLNNNINTLNNKYNNTIEGNAPNNSEIHNMIHEDEEIKSTSSYEELLLSFDDLNKSEIKNKFIKVKYENCNNDDQRKITPTFETSNGIEYPSFCKYNYNSRPNQKIEVINKVCMKEVKDKKKENYIVYKKMKDNNSLKNTTLLNHNTRNQNKQSFKFTEFSLKKKNTNLKTKAQKKINIKNDNNNDNNIYNNNDNNNNNIDISNMSSNELTIKEITDSSSFILSSSCLSKENFKNDNKRKDIEFFKSNKDDSTENSNQHEEKNNKNFQECKPTLSDILLKQLLKEKNEISHDDNDDDKGYSKTIHKNDNIHTNCNVNKYDIDKSKNISINNNTIYNKHIKKEYNPCENYKNKETKNIKLDKKKKGDESIKNYEQNLQDIYIKNNTYCNNYMKKSKDKINENSPIKKSLPTKDNTSKLDPKVYNNMYDNIYNMLNKNGGVKENKRDSIPDYVSMADSIFHLEDCKDSQSNHSHIQELQDECVEKIHMQDNNDIYYSSTTNKKNDEMKGRNDIFKNHNIYNRRGQSGNKNVLANNKCNELNNLHKKENNILNKDAHIINSVENNVYKNDRSVKNLNDIINKRFCTPEIVTKVLKIEESINDNTFNIIDKKDTPNKHNKGPNYISNEIKENKKEVKSNSLKRYLNKTCDNLNITSRINMLNKTSPTISFLNKTSMNNKNVDKEDNYKKYSDSIKRKSYNSEDLLYKGNFYKNVRRAYKIENKQPFGNKKDKKVFKVDDNNVNKNRTIIYDHNNNNNNNNVYTHNMNSKNYINTPNVSLNTSYGNINSLYIREENPKNYNRDNKQNIINDSKNDKQNLQYININKNKNSLQCDSNYIKNESIKECEENYVIRKQPNYIGTNNGENNINNITSTIKKNVNNYFEKLKNLKDNNNNNNMKNIYSGNTVLNNNPYNYIMNNNKINYIQHPNLININNNNDKSYFYSNNNPISVNHNNNISHAYQHNNNNNPIKKEDNAYNTSRNKNIPYMLNRFNPFIQPNYGNKKNICNNNYFVQSTQPHINNYTANNQEPFANLNNNVYNKFNMSTCEGKNTAYNNLCIDQNKMYLLNQYQMRCNQNINQTHNELNNQTKNNMNHFIDENNIAEEKNIYYNKQNIRPNNDGNKKIRTPLSEVPEIIGEDNSYIIYKMNDEKNIKNYVQNNITNINNHIMKNVDNNIHKNQYIYKAQVKPKYITPQISNINMKNNLNHMVKRINHIYPKNQNAHINHNININNNINNMNNIKNINYLNEERERNNFIQMNMEYLKNIPMDKNKKKLYYPHTNVTNMGQNYEKQINASNLIRTVINKDNKNNVENKECQLPLPYYNVTQKDISNENNFTCLNINQIKPINHPSYDENNVIHYTNQKENYIKKNYNNFQYLNDMKSFNKNEKPINLYANNNLLYKKNIEKENEIKNTSNMNTEENNILEDTNNYSNMKNNVFLKSESRISNNDRKFSPSFGNINNEDIKNNNYEKHENIQVYTNSQTFELNIQLDEYTCKEIAFTYRDILDEKVIPFINDNKLKKTFLNPIKEKMRYMMQNGIVKWYISITEFL
ncbi:conserved Plasmodium protein, unknown function [Plasmodium gaboni]|uniref:Uncharacterized protein n=1 Tax=Plasmodium gaboni TaxID=647221 RepID=A0ABY1UTE4_9APIC|nr:conserved Plasmodium protein, unknown function [Plasmodium gaboni]